MSTMPRAPRPAPAAGSGQPEQPTIGRKARMGTLCSTSSSGISTLAGCAVVGRGIAVGEAESKRQHVGHRHPADRQRGIPR